jgi:hypothetical protein
MASTYQLKSTSASTFLTYTEKNPFGAQMPANSIQIVSTMILIIITLTATSHFQLDQEIALVANMP